MKFISSRDNAAFKRLRDLAEDSRTRRAEAATLIDGDNLLRAALDAGWPISQLVLREDVLEAPDVRAVRARVAAACPAAQELVLSVALFKAVSPVVTPTGVLAEIPTSLAGQAEAAGEDVLVLAGVQDAGNLGSLLRTAAAAGVRRVWLDRFCTQPWSPKAMRAGMGAQFCLAIEEDCDLHRLLAARSAEVLVTTLGEGSQSLYAFDLKGPSVWVFGSEGQGVPADLQALAGRKVRIPMPGAVESLNVGAAVAACLFEQVRQRVQPA